MLHSKKRSSTFFLFLDSRSRRWPIGSATSHGWRVEGWCCLLSTWDGKPPCSTGCLRTAPASTLTSSTCGEEHSFINKVHTVLVFLLLNMNTVFLEDFSAVFSRCLVGKYLYFQYFSILKWLSMTLPCVLSFREVATLSVLTVSIVFPRTTLESAAFNIHAALNLWATESVICCKLLLNNLSQKVWQRPESYCRSNGWWMSEFYPSVYRLPSSIKCTSLLEIFPAFGRRLLLILCPGSVCHSAELVTFSLITPWRWCIWLQATG